MDPVARGRSLRVTVTGATGFVGGHTAAALVSAGHRVTALVRDPDRLSVTMASLGLDAPSHVVGDMTDPDAVGRALDGADAVVHCAAVVSLDPRDEAEMVRANAAGFDLVVGGAVERGLDPVVHTSSTSALFRPGVGRLDVHTAVAGSTHVYGRSKAQCERAARRFQDDGAPVVITYPAGILGPAAGAALGETSAGLAGFLRGGIMPTRRAALSVIDVRDLAAAHVALMEPGRGPRRVMAGGHVVSMETLARILRGLTGRRFPIPPVPPAALRGAGRVMDALGPLARVSTPLTSEGMTLITRWAGTDDRTLHELGIRPRDLMETFEASLLAWRDAGLVEDRHLGRLSGR